MAATGGRAVPTSASVSALHWGVYTDEEIDSLAVLSVTNPALVDALQRPQPGGLYDPAMGPLDAHSRCATCRLQHAFCPGHCGKLELPVPVFNPLLLPVLLRLLKSTCLHCFHLRLPRDSAARTARALRLLRSNRVPDALAVLHSNPHQSGQFSSSSRQDGGADGANQTRWTTHSYSAFRETVSSMLRSIPSRCANCKAYSPSIKNEAQTKLYRSKLASKREKANTANGINIERSLAYLIQQQEQQQREKSRVDRMSGAHENGSVAEERDKEDEELTLPSSRGAEGAESEGSEEDEDGDDDTGCMEDSDGGQAKQQQQQQHGLDDSSRHRQYISPTEARAIIQALWANDTELVRSIYMLEVPNKCAQAAHAHVGAAASDSACKLFMSKILVPPNRFRPHAIMDGELIEHPQNTYLGRLLNAKVAMEQLYSQWKEYGAESISVKRSDDDERTAYRRRLLNLLNDMQTNVNKLLDSSAGATGNADATGIRQQLEKKEGLFRMNLMGKRVNFAARSVISPDPHIHPEEIGVPPFIATRLTFPEPVTKYNSEKLKQLVENGADCHPGATAVEDEHGRMVDLTRMPLGKRRGAALLLTSPPATKRDAAGSTGRKPAFPSKAVHRHLRDGDMLLMNRQPTLHKPGVMAHRARILHGQRTLRLHYANCSTYNADFDGDEMNLHLCQDQLGRAEANYIVSANRQYTVPTDGKPLRGLIQDHVASGVLLTMKDTFMPKESFSQLLIIACEAINSSQARRRPSTSGGISTNGAGIDTVRSKAELRSRRRIRIPIPAVLKPMKLWTGKQLIGAILDELTRGKQTLSMESKPKLPVQYFGEASGEGKLEIRNNRLVRGVVDKAAYGNTSLVHAVHELYGPDVAGDLLSALSQVLTVFLQSHGLTCGVDDLLITRETEKKRENMLSKADDESAKVAAEFAGCDPSVGDEKLRSMLRERLHERPQGEVDLDMRTSGALSPITSDTMQSCLPAGQQKPFPRNQLSLIISTGAKGSLVNHSQIAALLGQQELEGRRVPRMSSGKTLPCFKAFDTSARAGGFVTDRFLSGLRPPEYFFHCLAGREGLVDTAVKTARSGYLQRCIMKNLESLQVAYDGSVRDCDGSLMQLKYGEDGIDNTQTAYLDKMDFYVKNAARMEELYGNTADALRQRLNSSERTNASLPEQLVARIDEAARKAVVSSKPGLHSEQHFRHFSELVRARLERAQMAPGEPCGVLAAQSMGEPSTQMTLNTFHFAGRSGANVTLGIPRLRELLMTASKNISTPVMTLPISSGRRKDADSIASSLRRTTMAELLENIRVIERSKLKSRSGNADDLRDSSDPEAVSVPRREYTVVATFRVPSSVDTKDDSDGRGQTAEAVSGEHQGSVSDCAASDKMQAIQFSEMHSCFHGAFLQKFYQALKSEVRRMANVNISSKRERTSRATDEQAEAGDDEGYADGEGKQEKIKTQDEEAVEDDEDDDVEEGAKAESRRKGVEPSHFDSDQPELDKKDESRNNEEGAQAEVDDVTGAHHSNADAVHCEEPADGSHHEVYLDSNHAQRKHPANQKAKSSSSRKKASIGGLLSTLSSARETLRADAHSGMCEATVSVSTAAPKMLALELAERAARSAVVREVQGIGNSFVVEGGAGGVEGMCVQTDGINFSHVCAELDERVDLSSIRANDVHAMLKAYGVEAARSTLITEVRSVFSAYGIGVDLRHINLIADWMTFTGEYRACSRLGMLGTTSPLQKMSFEQTTGFLRDAVVEGTSDGLESPSSRLVVGRPIAPGTGCMELKQMDSSHYRQPPEYSNPS